MLIEPPPSPPPPPPSDTTNPTVSITSPTDNALISESLQIDVSASDNVGVDHVDFYVDGGFYVSDYSAPFSHTWTDLTSGQHTITAVAKDAAWNSASDSVTLYFRQDVSVSTEQVLPNIYSDPLGGWSNTTSVDRVDLITHDGSSHNYMKSPKKAVYYGIFVGNLSSEVYVYQTERVSADSGWAEYVVDISLSQTGFGHWDSGIWYYAFGTAKIRLEVDSDAYIRQGYPTTTPPSGYTTGYSVTVGGGGELGKDSKVGADASIGFSTSFDVPGSTISYNDIVASHDIGGQSWPYITEWTYQMNSDADKPYRTHYSATVLERIPSYNTVGNLDNDFSFKVTIGDIQISFRDILNGLHFYDAYSDSSYTNKFDMTTNPLVDYGWISTGLNIKNSNLKHNSGGQYDSIVELPVKFVDAAPILHLSATAFGADLDNRLFVFLDGQQIYSSTSFSGYSGVIASISATISLKDYVSQLRNGESHTITFEIYNNAGNQNLSWGLYSWMYGITDTYQD